MTPASARGWQPAGGWGDVPGPLPLSLTGGRGPAVTCPRLVAHVTACRPTSEELQMTGMRKMLHILHHWGHAD